MGEGKILVAIPMGMDFKELKKELENNRKDWFPIGGDIISVNGDDLMIDPTDATCFLFKVMGIIEDEETTK